MLSESVISQTLVRFPGYQAGECAVSPLEKGGSDRKFYRIRTGADHSMIVVKYSGQKEENRHYVDIARFLGDVGVRVPRIFFHDSDEGLIWMQDLGEVDLWAHRDAGWDVRRPLYEAALDEISKLHTAATRRVDGATVRLEKEFNEQLYLWEQNYFFEHCLGAHFGLSADEQLRIASLPALRALASHLAHRPRTLVHRDFQSQNILILDSEAWLIDFQGMRPGLPQYDLASLLWDPYVSLSPTERDHLLRSYKTSARARGMVIEESFDEVLLGCAMQRLMQALGAYGFLGLQRGRRDFLCHIPTASRSLREVAARLDGMDPLVQLLDSLP